MKLSKADEGTFNDLVKRGEEASSALGDAADKYNKAVQEAWEEFEAEVQDSNSVIDEIREFAEAQAEGLRCEFDEKSEKWQKSEKGQDALRMVEGWENFSTDQLSFDAPDEIDLGDAIIHEDFEQLPTDSE